MNRIGIVVQRCHESLVGGAESLAWQWANLLKNSYQVEVLTTTALDAATWENVLPAGGEGKEGITIRRFEVNQKRTPYWHELHKLLQNHFRDPLSDSKPSDPPEKYLTWPLALQEEFIYKQGPYSEGLIDFLSGSFQDYKSLIFFTYLFPTTYYGIRQVQENGVFWSPRFTMRHRLISQPTA